MSTVKVNKITPRTSNSIQLGESGDTLTIPSGATLQNCGTATGFGISFCTTVKTSPFTATAGKGFFINTGSAVTVTLPASPSAGDELIVIDSTGQAATNNITLGRNGSKIKGQCIDAKLNVDRGGLRIVYSGASQGWITATAGNDATADTSAFITATGGTITTVCTNYKVHTFTSDGTFCVSAGAGPLAVADYLVIAGGGATGSSNHGGGSGAGGYRESKCATVSGCWTASPLASATSLSISPGPYSVTVGAGAAAGNNGSNSVFSTITSAGGGKGGSAANGSAGGSGGGGYSETPGTTTGGAGNTPPVSPPQGNAGGNGNTSPNTGTGGGGGAGAVGSNGSGNTGGNGGTGVASSIDGTPTTRAGGGGGGTELGTNGSGGAGGGGNAGPGPSSAAGIGSAGTANTGGGGGGGTRGPGSSGDYAGGAGGSGVVIIRYKFQ